MIIMTWVYLFGPMWIGFILLLIWYCKTYKLITQMPLKTPGYKRLFIYPLILGILFLPASIDRFLLNHLSFGLAIFHMIF